MIRDHIILAIAWTVFCLLHSILASGAMKRRTGVQMQNGFQSYRLLYTLFAFASFTAVVVYQLLILSKLLFQPFPLIKIAGGICCLVGLIVMLLSIYKYFYRLSGLRWLLKNDNSKLLMLKGIHQYVRHPLYLGTFIFIWGMFLALPYWSLLISNFIITVYTLIGIRFEETKLEKEFGASYTAYKKKVPMIIPTFRDRS